MSNRYEIEGSSEAPILRIADLFAINKNGVGSHIFSKTVKTVFLRFSDAITSEENINIQAKISEGGSHTGSDGAAVLSDSTKNWTVDALIGKRVYNLSDGSVGDITANSATTVTAVLSGGTDDDWDTGDRYLILDEENRFLQAIEPYAVSATEFLVVMDGCELFSNEVLEIEFDNTDGVSLLSGSNVVYD
jgi:hypothetical protein